MKQISRKIAYAFVSLATLSVSAAVPQLSIAGKEGSFTHVELPEGVSVLHSSDEGEGVPEMLVTLPSGRIISMPVNELESCKVVNTSLPAFNIHFTDYPDAEQLWLKEEYINATLDIHGNGAVEDQLGLELTMKGRGNTTWFMAKKPMRLKFSKKISLCGFKKAKNYVLLANYIDQTHMHNSVAMWLGKQIGVTYTNHFQPVDVFINDRYVGLFLLTEKVGINSGSVDIDEEKGVLFELSVEYDEPYKFRSPIYDLPVMVKDPDFDELAEDNPEGMSAEERLAAWQADFSAAEAKVNEGKCFEAFDLDSFVKYILVQDIVKNFELGHPKSLYIHKTELGAQTKYVFGPLWDFDFTQDCVTYNDNKVEHSSSEQLIWLHDFLKKMASTTEFKTRYIELFNDFYMNIYPELLKFMDNSTDILETSAELDGKRWTRTERFDEWMGRIPSSDYKAHAAHHKEWIKERVEYLKKWVDAGANR